MKLYKESKLAKNKILGAVALLFCILGTVIVIYRLSAYVFEFDEKYSPIDYGTFNWLCFFTVQSNILVNVYLGLVALACFGCDKIKRFVFHPMFGAMTTAYILVTGVVYCCGIPMGFATPYQWDTPYHSMFSFIQIYHHMIIPPLMLALWFFPFDNRRISYKNSIWFMIYPMIYSILSIIRGSVDGYFVYPFYNPDFIWKLFFGDAPVNAAGAYSLLIPVLIFGMAIFVGLGCLMILIHNKMSLKQIPDDDRYARTSR